MPGTTNKNVSTAATILNDVLIIQAFALPNTSVIRKIIQEKSTESIVLRRFLTVFENYDLALRAYRAYKNNRDISYISIKELIVSLNRLHTSYDEKKLAAFLEDKRNTYHVRDTLALIRSLNDISFNLLLELKVRIRDLHDWLVEQYNRQVQFELQEKYNKEISQHINKQLKIPAPVARQLTMEINGFCFSLPTESLELLKAGQSL